MIKTDLILCQPRHLDYPWFRYNLLWMRPYFNKIYIALTQDTMPPDITEFLVHAPEYEGVRWVRPPRSDGKNDWRNLAMRDVIINFSRSPYVLFLEQDFLMTENFLKRVIGALEQYDWIYYKEGDRIHPSFSLVARENIDKAELDFSAHPRYDHFYTFFDTLPFKNRVELRELGFKEGEDFFHMAGLSNCYHVHKLGQPFYKPENFLAYNGLCLKLPITHEASFKKLCEEIKDKHGTGNCEWIQKFFPQSEEVNTYAN